MKILIVEDNPKLAEGLSDVLRTSNFVVDIVSTADEADAAIVTHSFDLVILDLNLPDQDGLELLQNIRNRGGDTPVLIVTARTDMREKIKGLDLGADDYMTKPFDINELEARIRALIRRSAGKASSCFKFSNLVLDIKKNTFMADGKLIDLTPREFAVLRLMLMAKGSIVSKQQIIDSLSTFDIAISENALEQSISRLRKRLMPHGVKVLMARGLGYYLTEGEELNL